MTISSVATLAHVTGLILSLFLTATITIALVNSKLRTFTTDSTKIRY